MALSTVSVPSFSPSDPQQDEPCIENAHELLSPYQHELNGEGTACAHDCPACTWVECRTLADAPMK